jgi:hypothetical protein
MNEAFRVARDGATFTIVHPYQFSVRAWQDPTHRRALNEASWRYYSAEWRKLNGLDHYPISCDWVVVGTTMHLADEWTKVTDDERNFAVRHFVNVVDDLTVELVARKLWRP